MTTKTTDQTMTADLVDAITGLPEWEAIRDEVRAGKDPGLIADLLVYLLIDLDMSARAAADAPDPTPPGAAPVLSAAAPLEVAA